MQTPASGPLHASIWLAPFGSRTDLLLDFRQFLLNRCLPADRVQLLLEAVGRRGARRGLLLTISLVAERIGLGPQPFGVVRGAAFSISSRTGAAEQNDRFSCRLRLSGRIRRLECFLL